MAVIFALQLPGDARDHCLIVCPFLHSSNEQWRMVVIVTGYTIFETSQCDVIFTFANPTFWRILLTQHAYYSTRTLLTRYCTMCHCTGVWGGIQGGQAHPQNFWFGENPGKICGNLGKMCEHLRKIALCALILQKWHPKSKCTLFLFWRSCFFSPFRASQGKFGQVWGKFRQKWCLKCFDLKKCAQHEKKCSRFFGGHFLWRYFSGKFGEIWAKILHTPKNLPIPTRMCHCN